MKKSLIVWTVLGFLIPSSLWACSPEAIWALRSANRVIAGEILSVTRLADGDRPRFSVEIMVREVLLGQSMNKEIIHAEMELWKPAKDPSYERDKSYVLYLRKGEPITPNQGPHLPWHLKYGMRSIQPDTEKLRQMLPPNDGQDKNHPMVRKNTNIDKLAPLDRKLHSIIIPEIDFSCASIYDVIDFIQLTSIKYDPSNGPQDDKGVNIVLNARSLTAESPMQINYYLDSPSLLQVLNIVAAFTGEREILDDWIVISGKGFGKLKPALSIGEQGTNSVMYKALQAKMIPEAKFQEASMKDVTQVLTEKSGIKLVWDTRSGTDENVTKVTLAARHTSLLSILKVLSVLHSLEISIGDSSVTIRTEQGKRVQP